MHSIEGVGSVLTFFKKQTLFFIKCDENKITYLFILQKEKKS